MARSAGRGNVRRRGENFWTKIAVAVLMVVITVGFLYFAYGPVGPENVLPVDWRLKLIINYNGTGFTIPADIGKVGGILHNETLLQFGPPGYAPVSTRDTSGTIYIQSTIATSFSFGDFFNIWGQPLNSTCVLNYCGGQGRPLPSWSDGTANRNPCINRNLFLSNGKTWIITLGTTPPSGGCTLGTGG